MEMPPFESHVGNDKLIYIYVYTKVGEYMHACVCACVCACALRRRMCAHMQFAILGRWDLKTR